MSEKDDKLPEPIRRKLSVADPAQHLQQLVDTALDAVITCDSDSRITVWNSGAERLFGWSTEEAIGLRLTDTIIPEEFREAHTAGMARYLRTGEGPVLGQRIEIEAIDRSGRRFPVELSINPIRNQDGLGFSGFIREISDRLEAERRIREGEERLQLIFDAADEGVWDYQFDESGRVIDAFHGEKARQLLGEDADRLPADRASLFEEDRQAVRRAWTLHWEGVEDVFNFEYRVRSSDDDGFRWVRERGKVVRRTKSGAPLRVVGSVVDVTARRRLEETLLIAQKGEALGLVAGGFAHDLNNVLSIIRGHTSILKHNKALDLAANESLDVIELAVARARTLTQNMLQLGRPMQTQRRATPINEVLEETLELSRPAMPKSIHIRHRLELTAQDVIYLNAEQLQQVILNLMINARDAMEQGGSLDLVAFVRDTPDGSRRMAVIQVVDSGCGIPEEFMETVFEPFFTTKGAAGTGLGLATAKKFAEDAGGSIRIVSRAGTGTTIELELPLQAREAPEPAVPNPASSDRSEQARILLAEDHELLRPMLKGAIAMGGHVVDAVADATGVREVGLTARPDLMVMDIDLPGGRGNELAEEIRAHWQAEIPVVYITGNSSFNVGDDETTALLRKPFDLEHLINAIDRMLGPA